MARFGHTQTSARHLEAVRKGNRRGRGRNLMNVTPAEREAIEPFADFCRRQRERVLYRIGEHPGETQTAVSDTGLADDHYELEIRGRV
jgi:hypothetical protein